MAPVTYDVTDRIAMIAVANPPVNALSQAVRAALVDAVARFASDAEADIAVIHGEGRLFIGGADISEFGRPPVAPTLPDVIAGIEACPKPIVAAMHGTALGGGLEVALGCHWRLAMLGTKLGLPEVTLGLLPGAGGTQRLPRLMGLSAAGRMISGGVPVKAAEAFDLGLIDRIGFDGEVVQAGAAFAAELMLEGRGARPVRDMPAPEGDLTAMRETMAAKARGQVAAVAALDAVAAAATMDFDAGLAEERRLFLELMETPQRAGLIHAFFAERAVGKIPGLAGVAPRPVECLGVVGGGTMGSGIATAALLADLPVILLERDAAAAERARKTIEGYLDAAVKRGRIDAERRDFLLDASLLTVTDPARMVVACVTVEAVFEDMDVKRAMFATLDDVARPGAILATNTSYLDVDAIAAATRRPSDVIGLHFFSPAHVMKLLEVVVADATAPDVVATAFALAKRLGKIPVRSGVCDGFIGNRILSAWRAAVDHMVLDGADPYAVDRALEAFGFAMGPYRVSDLAGLDIGFATRERKAPQADPRDRRPTFADALYHAGRLGQKSGRGYYDYASDRKGAEDPAVAEIVAAARSGPTRTFSDDEIVRRTMAAMVNEAARVVGEGIAARPLDVDVVLLHGYGFPRWRGGPMHWADGYGLDRVLADIRDFAHADDHFWRPAPLLETLVAEGRGFASLNEGERS